MMVGDKNGVARRLGLGRVLAVQWAKQNLEWETIVLE